MNRTSRTAQPAGIVAAERYVAFWNASSPAEQHRLAVEVFTETVESHVPIGVLRGREELIDFRNQFATHHPDFQFRSRQQPDGHHDRGRLQWELLANGASFASGTDVLSLDGQGRITSVTGFLDRAPAGFEQQAHD